MGRRRRALRGLVALLVVLAGLSGAAPASAAHAGLHLLQQSSCDWLVPGESSVVRVGLHNATSEHLLRAEVVPRLDPGWTAEVLTGPSSVERWGQRYYDVRVTPPADAAAGTATLRFDATAGPLTASLAFTLPVVSAPSPPTAVVATPGDATATVTWQPGLRNGLPDADPAQRVYVVTASPGGARASARGDAVAEVAGLVNGTAYRFTVTEWNEWGETASAPSAPVVPVGVPAQVDGVAVTGGGTARTVTWDAPADNGAALTGYTVTAHPAGPVVEVPAGTTAAEVTGLDPEAAYEFTVHATNAAGDGLPSPLPGAPGEYPGTLHVGVTDDGTILTLDWLDSGDADDVSGWEYVTAPRGITASVPRHEHEGQGYGFDAPGFFEPGTTVAVTVRPVNRHGAGRAVVHTVTTRATSPEPVVIDRVIPGREQVHLCFRAGWDRGRDVTGYVVQDAYTEASVTVPATARAATFAGLPAGGYAELRARAVSPGAYEHWSEPRHGATDPYRPPVLAAAAEPRDGGAHVRWETDQSVQWGAVEVVASPGGATQVWPVAGTDPQTVFRGLPNGVAHTFTIRTFDEHGYSAPVTTAAVTPGPVPSAVPGLAVTPYPGDPGAALLTWSAAGPDAPNPVTAYTVHYEDPDSGWPPLARLGADARSFRLEPLSPGYQQRYWVVAHNASGSGAPGAGVVVTNVWAPPTTPPPTTPPPTSAPPTTPPPTAPPDTTPPAVVVVHPPAVTLTGTAGLSYASSDAATYDVRYRVARWDGAFGAYRYPAAWQGTATTSVSGAAARGWTYCYGVRARDAAGNLGGWSRDACTAAPLDDRSLAASPSWSRGTSTRYFAGTYTATTTRNATLTLAGVRARRLALVATRCAACGTVGVYVDGTLVAKVSLAAAATAYRAVVAVPLPAYTTGTVTLKALSGRAYVDGLAVTRV